MGVNIRMRKYIKVSIVVNVYNIEKYIRDCINSLITQTYTNIEIILVDDGSTDKSGSICDEFAQKDERIKVIHKKMEDLVRLEKVELISQLEIIL